jgi:ElaB/YqjD/DUF883 family membrane-anchored ribosome-binding protein
MSYPMCENSDSPETLAANAGELLDTAASEAGKRYDEARKGLAAILEQGKDIYGLACERAVRNTRAADGVLHDNLYQTVLVGMGVGAVLGYLIARRCTA